MKKKAIIELFGLPGSGKTTFRDKLVHQLYLKGLKVYSQDEFSVLAKERYFESSSRLKKYISKVAFKFEKRRILEIFKHTHTQCVDFIHEALRGLKKSDRKVLRNYLYKTMIQVQLFDFYGLENEIMVIDEGMVHRAHSIYGYERNLNLDTEMIIEYLKVVPHLNTVIYVQVDREVAKKRVLNRALPNRMQTFSANNIEHFFSLNKRIVDVIDEYFKTHSNKYFIINNNSNSVSELDLNMKHLVNEIHSILLFERSQ